jgi:hypothetical protein
VPNICILNHFPEDELDWWTAPVPVAPGSVIEMQICGLQYHAQTETSRFLEILPLFSGGIEIVQTYKKVPAALLQKQLPRERANGIWKSNGLFLHFELPHPHESALVSCVDRAYLQSLAERLGLNYVVS